MKLYIRNMVCPRCVTAVEQLLMRNGLQPDQITLGEVTLRDNHIDQAKLEELNHQLKQIGFELINDKQRQTIESIKSIIIKKIHHEEGALENQQFNWSQLLADGLQEDYKNISRLFSTVEGITIEHFIIKQKIEKVKELLIYDQLTLSEIAWKLGYSSVAHLSAQFQKVTGMSPTIFKKQSNHSRKFIDQI